MKYPQDSNMKPVNVSFYGILIVMLFIPLVTFAQIDKREYTLLEPLPCITSPGVTCTGGNLAPQTTVNINTYVIYAFNLMIALAAVAAVFMITWGGFLYMTSDTIPHKTDGLKKVQDAIIGLLMVLCTFIIMRTVNPKLVEVPPSLVPPIAGLQTASSSDLFRSLRTEYDKADVRAQEALRNAEAANELSNDLAKQKANLKIQRDELARQLGNDDPQVKKLDADIANLDNKIGEAKAKVEVNLATANISSGGIAETARKLNGETKLTNINTKIDAGIAGVKKLADEARAKLTTSGQSNQINAAGGVNDQANYAEYVLELMRSDSITNNTRVVETAGVKRAQIDDTGFIGIAPNPPLISVAKTNALTKIKDTENKLTSIQDQKLRDDLGTRIEASRALVNNKYK